MGECVLCYEKRFPYSACQVVNNLQDVWNFIEKSSTAPTYYHVLLVYQMNDCASAAHENYHSTSHISKEGSLGAVPVENSY